MSALKMTLEIIDFYCFNITSKGFLTMFIGIPYLTMCATRTEMTQVVKKKPKFKKWRAPQNIITCDKQFNAIDLFADGNNGSHGL